jgi:phosphoglycolate phosphatase-like HAD superfamily hydrolase/ribosomal protein S18 acetylase RimI-like enzyme
MSADFAALLFDIDGTLLRAGGAGRRAFEAALQDHTGRPLDGAVSTLRFDGMTDRGIVREALGLLGRSFEEAVCHDILERYLARLPGELAAPGFEVLPGVVPLLTALSARRARYGLCTGNIADGARLKLRRGDLERFFDWGQDGMHGFAGDGEARPLVVAAALRRVAAGLARPVAASEVLVIGDTPRDVQAAHAAGCPCLGVATGSFDEAALRAAGADWVVSSLEDPAGLALLQARTGPPEAFPSLPPLQGPRLAGVEAARADQGRLQACLDAAPDYFVLTEGAPAAPDAAARLLDESELDPLRRILLLAAHGEGEPLGLVDLWLDQPEPGTVHLGLLLVREGRRGRGYGAEATAALERSLAAAGFGWLRLSVGDENPEARAFWERLGFAEVGRLDRGVTVYEKPLAG